MRVSSSALYETTATEITNSQSRLVQLQRQIASGRKIFNASDDPVGATRVLDLQQKDSMNTQFVTNREAVRTGLSFAEGTLQNVTNLLQEVRDVAMSAGNSQLTNNSRQALATDLKGRLQELVGLANTTDETGNYMFAGFQSNVIPFVDTPAGVGYFGDDGQRLMQVSASRQMESSHSGADVFMRVRSGNGAFDVQASAGNSGSAIASAGSVVDAASMTTDNYSINFRIIGGQTSYEVVNNTTGTQVLNAGTPYVDGQAITFEGMQLSIKGKPGDGDMFSVTPSASESVFKTINDLVTALSTPVVGSNLTNSLQRGIRGLDNALDNVLGVRANMGLHLNELDSLDSMGSDFEIQFKQSLSTLQDADYAKSVTDLAQQKMVLDAALQSFAKVSALSLFDYIR